MATLPELARAHAGLDVPDIDHLQRLVGSWNILADLSFADLLLFLHVPDADGARFVVAGQMRPSTSQTLHREDLVGADIDEVDRPLVARAWRLGEIVDGEVITVHGEPARVQCIPVRRHGRMVAVMTRESPVTVGRRETGELERVYVEIFSRFARMLVNGDFPFTEDDLETEESPRVGDGVLLLDEAQRIEYSSPNAVNALHRMGITSQITGVRLDELGLEENAVRTAFATGVPVTEEIERPSEVVVLLRCMPLLDSGRVGGGLVLLRDVTDLRRRDRLILSKDATIREVHHRVKNNLQTISSLLRLQARRLEVGDARVAIEEAERRVRSIAVVHDFLSREVGEQAPFDDIVRHLVRMAEDTLLGVDLPVEIRVTGDAGELPADVATPLALALTELLQNAGQHAFAGTLDIEKGWVELRLENDGEQLHVRVADNGVGMPQGIDIDATGSLGLSIVRDLVVSQLGGTIDARADAGTVVELAVPLRSDARAEL